MRRFLPGALLAIGVLLVFSSRSQSIVPLIGSLQTVLPVWEGLNTTDQKVTDEEKRVAGMTDYVARVFWKDSSNVAFTTYVGYYDRQSQGHSMHSPKNCLPGAGWEILETNVATIASPASGNVVVNKYLLKNGTREAVVYYWYQGRGRIVASEYAVKWNLLHDAALLGHTEEALVRVVAYVPRASELPAGSTAAQAHASAEQLGAQVASRLLTEVARVIPPSNKQTASREQSPTRSNRTMASSLD
ncbi:MAG: exosortase C-terminal domain/associated protein EpsI [bacterium]